MRVWNESVKYEVHYKKNTNKKWNVKSFVDKRKWKNVTKFKGLIEYLSV